MMVLAASTVFRKLILVPWVGLEPTRDYSHTYLKRTRMPIPPPGQDHYFQSLPVFKYQ